MADNFQDNISFGSSTLGVSGDAVAVGTAAGAKSIIFNNSNSAGHLAWQPNANATFSIPAAGGTAAIVGGQPGAIAAGTQTAASGTIVYSNSNNITFGLSGSTRMTASYNFNVSAGTTSNNLNSLSFSNGSGVSFGLNAGTLTASVATSLTNINLSAGTTSNNLSALVFSNSNNVSFGLNGSTITATITVPAQTVDTLGLYALGNTTQNSSTTLDARSLSFNGLGAMTFGYSNGSIQVSAPGTSSMSATGMASIFVNASTLSIGAAMNVSAGTTSNNITALTFSNLNGVSFGINGSVITASAAGGANLNVSAGTTSNNLTALTFSNINGVSFGLNGSVLTASIAPGGGAITNINISGGTTSNNLSNFVMSNSNNISFGVNGSTITGSFALNVSGGTTSNNLSALVFSNSNNVSFGFNNGTITATVGEEVNFFEPFPMWNALTTTYAPANGSLYIQPFVLPLNILSGRLNIMRSFNSILIPTSSASFVSNTTGSRGINYVFSHLAALYSLGSGTNSTRIESVWSNTWSLGLSQQVSIITGGATTISATNNATISYIASVGTNGAYTTSSTNASHATTTGANSLNSTAISSGLSSLNNMLSAAWIIPTGINANLTPGDYWLAQAYFTAASTSGTTAAALSVVGQTVLSIALQTNRLFGQTTTNGTSQYIMGRGVFSITTTGIPATIAFNAITQTTNGIQYFNILQSNA